MLQLSAAACATIMAAASQAASQTIPGTFSQAALLAAPEQSCGTLFTQGMEGAAHAVKEHTGATLCEWTCV